MADRAGPPTPRDEPWRMPTPPLPEQPGRTPVPARERAWQTWSAEQDQDGYRMSTQERACAKAAWNAGWEARR